MRLSKRLALIAGMVQSGSKVCDVGTDHGYLPVFLYKSGKCASVCATDIREKPYENARKNIEDAGISGIKLFLCDGLESITRDMADTIIIAGMGGEVISGIIERAQFLRDDTVTLIIQPTTSADKLREYLSEIGFVVVTERAVEDNGKIYSVMKCQFAGIPYPIDLTRKAVGLITPDYDEGRAYIEKQYNIALKRAEELENTNKNTFAYFESMRLSTELKKLLDRRK